MFRPLQDHRWGGSSIGPTSPQKAPLRSRVWAKKKPLGRNPAPKSNLLWPGPNAQADSFIFLISGQRFLDFGANAPPNFWIFGPGALRPLRPKWDLYYWRHIQRHTNTANILRCPCLIKYRTVNWSCYKHLKCKSGNILLTILNLIF
jgi:hypothetical protein